MFYGLKLLLEAVNHAAQNTDNQRIRYQFGGLF